MADGRETVYKWTDDDVAGLIRLRKTNDRLFSGKRFASAAGWEAILKEMGLTGVVTPARAGKKWENLKKTYKELRKPPTGSGTESGESTARDWKWFSLMDEAIGGRPSIRPPCLIASAWGETPPVSASASPDSVPPEPECQGAEQDSESEEPAPPKRQRRDPVLELLERQEKRAEEREKREEDREERLLNLLEKIVEKM
ncbi:hypothetical protein D5F01_LYC07367 [Larimichthys crocea]|uniref:Myb/SANT-like DNA-binding domain-containing protein n=1 Tax=Larimichthys crocea TaxID=215358 RepID=A0A6G0HRB0_LARCR|nr:hypothetical protein D5F01_LYC20734 [Larimichthys crocea]KAE8294414.1 hypothetical protein D5F01_LYC07367 [Larimichthys crocea]